MAQGIEVRNSEVRGVTTITNTNVSGAMEGIVAHVSRMDVFDSTVDSTTMRGIAVAEMSRGTVSGNQVFVAMDSGFYCGDMSRWEFSNNTAEGVVAGSGGRSTAGWGLMINYHTNASSTGDSFSGEAGGIGTLILSHLLDRSPFRNGT